MSVMRWVTGWAQVEIKGAQPEKYLSALAERGIGFWDAAPPADFTLRVKIPYGAAKLTPALAAVLGCEGRVESCHGLPALCMRALRRWWIPVGMFLGMMLLVASRFFIWDIEITGCEDLTERQVRQALAECGVDIGACWVGLSQDHLRNSVILRLPEIRWMTVSIRGSQARVIVREIRTGEEPVPEEELVRIVAEKAGLITAVYDLQGTAEVEENQVALPGETLIGGYATGRFGVQGADRAIGEVWARTWYEKTAAAPVTVDMTQDAGEQDVYFSLILGKKRINFYKGSSICPVDCDKILYVYPFAVEGVFALPLAVERTVVQPYERQSLRAEELRSELEQQLMAELLAEIGEKGEVLSAAFTASESEGVLYVTLRAECHETIGRSVPLTEAELYEIQSKIPVTEEPDT